MFGTTIVETVDSDVATCTPTISFNIFSVEPLRHETVKKPFGNGIMVVDGSKWTHARALIQSSFDTAPIIVLASLSAHVDPLMGLIPGDGLTIDLLPLFKRLVCRTQTSVLRIIAVTSIPSRLSIYLVILVLGTQFSHYYALLLLYPTIFPSLSPSLKEVSASGHC